MVDAELAALALDPLLRRARLAVNLARIPRICVYEYELADVVQQGGNHQPVTGLVAKLTREPVRGALGGDGVQTEALGNPLPDGRALKEVECPRAAGDRMNGARREHLDRLHCALDAASAAPVYLVCQPQDGDGEGHVGLDRADDVGCRRLAGLEQAHHAVAGLNQYRERLQRLKCSSQTTAVAFVVMALAGA